MSDDVLSKYLYGKYFQKSYTYLYPLIGVKKDKMFTATGTYLWWSEGSESIENYLLLVYFEENKGKLYKSFEKENILKNPYYESSYEVEGGMLYIFDMSSYKDAVGKFMEGKYSRLSKGVKRKILDYHGYSTDNVPRPGRFVHMSLNPEMYYEKVSEELNGYPVEILREVGELMDPYNKEMETLKIKIVGEFKENSLHLRK